MTIFTFPGYEPKKVFYGFIGKNSQEHTQQYIENKKALQHLFLGDGFKTYLLKQIHSNICITVTRRSMQMQEGDAMVTRSPKVLLCVKTADCVPIIFMEERRRVIGVAHAGWKGALNGIIPSTIDAMLALGANLENIKAIIGPAIQQDSYEVSEEFLKEFLKESTNNIVFFKSSVKTTHYQFDLPAYVMHKLKLHGINDILDMKKDTYANEKDFYSYRRSTHRCEKLDGHVLSVVGLK